MENEKRKWSEKIKDSFDVLAPGGTSIIGEFVVDAIAGQILPGVTTSIVSYRQKRFERNVDAFIKELKKREEELNKRLDRMEYELREQFREKYLGYVVDYVLDEQQEEKIKFLVNGLVNLAAHESITEDFVLTYYDTLETLRLVDLAILKMKYNSDYGREGKDFREVLNEFGLSYENYGAIREKLVRVGLFTTQRDEELEDLYNNVMEIQKFLEELTKGKAKKLSRFKRISKNDRYKMTRFGREFVEFFMSEETVNV